VQAALLSAYAVDLLPAEALRMRFSFPKPRPTMYELGWWGLQELRTLSRDVPSSEQIGSGASVGAGVGAGAGAGSVVLQGRDNLELPSGTEFSLTATGYNR